MWYVKLVEVALPADFSDWGVFPRKISGLKGIIFTPFIHSGFKHLINNSVPLFSLTLALLYFYKRIAYPLLLIFWLGTDILVWAFARNSYHIGASGIVYALASFIFFSGIFRRNINLMALSLLVSFLYGSMVWGIFPIREGMSWESHLFGGLIGLFCAYIFRHYGPSSQRPSWLYEDEEEEEGENSEDNDAEDIPWKINKNNSNYT
ncbi:MAG: rhomboid family intramembrane serine protease [Bacteroidetes bacterium]|jgi:membrane associated rhomboid family serine protease|nr:rhomboid family intramembrane serine protease [Bacteroidota bacterium]